MPSPFGIRRRIKRLLGLSVESKPAAPEDTGPKVQLIVVGPSGADQTIEGPAGTTLASLSMKLQRPIATGCPDTTCGTCHVDVLEGAEHLTPADGRERATLKQQGLPEGQRLACRAAVTEGTVKVKAYELM